MPDEDRPVPRGRIRRTMPLAAFTARAAGGRLVAGLRERTGDDGAVERFHEHTAEHYAELLGHSKGVLMKAGQIFSMIDTRALGTGGFAPYQKALARLQADAPPMSPGLVHQLLADELDSVGAHFRDFDDDPMAAASVGQVHRAVLHDGRDVVVKIQYPGVAQAIRDDLANTELVTTFLRFLCAAAGMPVDVQALAREAAARISEEVDYRHEADMISAFSDLYRGHPFIRIPEAVPRASSDRVLTMTHLDGMDWDAAQDAGQELKNTWAEAIARFVNGNYRHANLVHADPHPGNYRFHADGTVGFLDFGCVTVLPERRRLLWVQFLRAAMDGRTDDYRELLTRMEFLRADAVLDDDQLRQWVSEMSYEYHEAQPFTYTPDAIGRIVRSVFDVRDRDHPVAKLSVPAEHAFTSRIMLAFSSVAAGLEATLHSRALLDDMDDVAEPISTLGTLHHAWVHERGLPGALERHDHP